MVFIWDMVINGSKIEDFDTDVKKAYKKVVESSIKLWNVWYIQKHVEGWYDFWVQKTLELFWILQEYVHDAMDTKILNILTENMLRKLWKNEDEYEELEERIDNYMNENDYDRLFIDLPELKNPLFRK